MEKYYATRFKHLRERLEFTQAEFADKLAITQKVLDSIERGTNRPSDETIESFVDIVMEYGDKRDAK